MGWTHEDPPFLEEGTTVVVLGGGIFATGSQVGNLCPILETFPPVYDGTCAREFPLGVDTIEEAKTNGEF